MSQYFTDSDSYTSCPYNPCLTFDFDLDLEAHAAVFHHECTICKPSSLESNGLCAPCQHLNLRHFLLCVPQSKWFYIVLGTIAEISKRPECPQCRVVTRIIQRNRAQAERQWKATVRDDNECILGRTHTNESSQGELYVQLFFFGREALKRYRGYNITRYYLQVRFRDLQLQIPTVWDPDKTPDPLHATAARDFGFSKITQSETIATIDSGVHWGRVLDLVRSCEDGHDHETVQNLSQGFTGPHYVVDVNKRCIVRTPAKCNYVTLSYVWGTPRVGKIRATKANIELLQREGSLSGESLSLTISDAMQVCTRLGEAYLWVDSLCIVQDDIEQKLQEIRVMGDIYSSSHLTIVAAAGNDAEAGLPGVSCATRSMSQLAVAFCGLEAVEVLPCFEATVEKSLWNTRAWTYQERILSRRTLYFTDCQVFFSCDSGIRYEDICGDQYLREYNHAPFRTHSWQAWHPWLQYTNRLAEYSTRKMTFNSDIFNAFAGVGQTVYQNLVEHYYGLPECNFDEALLWEADGPYQSRPCETVIPGWSWGSHRGPVKFSLCSYDNYAGSFIRFYIWSPQASSLVALNPTPYWNVWWPLPGASESTSSNPHIRALYLAIAWKDGCATSSKESHLSDKQLVALFKDRVEQQCGVPGDPTPISRSFERLDPEGIEAFPLSARKAASKPGTLLFRAPVAEFYLCDHSTYGSRARSYGSATETVTTLTLITTQGLCAGFVEVNQSWADYRLDPWEEDLPDHFSVIALSVGRLSVEQTSGVEFLLAHNMQPPKGHYQFPPKESAHLRKVGELGYTGDESTDTRYFDHLIMRMTAPIVNVMLVDQLRDPLENVVYSHRRGVGWVLLARWREAGSKLQTIVLR